MHGYVISAWIKGKGWHHWTGGRWSKSKDDAKVYKNLATGQQAQGNIVINDVESMSLYPAPASDVHCFTEDELRIARGGRRRR